MKGNELGLNFSSSFVPLTIFEGLLILCLSGLFGLLIRQVFYRYSNSMSSRRGFGNTLLMVTISTASLIAVVKSSLALSLGLVGALSVVRFRTAVKEPYNLAFILFSICVGISIGASQYSFAVLILIFGLSTIYLLNKFQGEIDNNGNLNNLDTITLDLPANSDVQKIYEILNMYVKDYSLQNFTENSKGSISLVFRVSIQNKNTIELIRNQLKKEFDLFNYAFYNSPSE